MTTAGIRTGGSRRARRFANTLVGRLQDRPAPHNSSREAKTVKFAPEQLLRYGRRPPQLPGGLCPLKEGRVLLFSGDPPKPALSFRSQNPRHVDKVARAQTARHAQVNRLVQLPILPRFFEPINWNRRLPFFSPPAATARAHQHLPKDWPRRDRSRIYPVTFPADVVHRPCQTLAIQGPRQFFRVGFSHGERYKPTP